jgi:cell division inhibitor SepF
MAGAMRKMGVYLGLVEDTDHYDDEYADYVDYDRYNDEQERAREVREARPVRAVREPGEGSVASLSERRRPAPGPITAELSRIPTLHPRTYNEARTIGENFREGVPVIMNLTEMDDNDAKRLVDFAAGLVFAVHGRIERVTSKVFLLSPPNVTVAAEDKQRIAEGGFFNQS